MVTLNTHRTTTRSGFTLIEILTVILILGIATAVVVPQIGSRNDLKVRAGARVLFADLMYAQNTAIAQQKRFFVKFDAANESYRVMDAAGPSGADNTIMHPVNKDPFVMQFGPTGNSRVSDIKIKTAVFNGVDAAYQSDFTLAFDELGTPYVYCYDQNGTNELLNGAIVLECGANEITVTIERYTGEIKVQ